jgi:hypothetical protein
LKKELENTLGLSGGRGFSLSAPWKVKHAISSSSYESLCLQVMFQYNARRQPITLQQLTYAAENPSSCTIEEIVEDDLAEAAAEVEMASDAALEEAPSYIVEEPRGSDDDGGMPVEVEMG